MECISSHSITFHYFLYPPIWAEWENYSILLWNTQTIEWHIYSILFSSAPFCSVHFSVSKHFFSSSYNCFCFFCSYFNNLFDPSFSSDLIIILFIFHKLHHLAYHHVNHCFHHHVHHRSNHIILPHTVPPIPQ